MNKNLPILSLYAKRKFVKLGPAVVYLKVNYKTDTLDRSMTTVCDYQSWDPATKTITNDPVATHELAERFSEITQKVLGAYYILTQNSPEVSLQEIVAVALDEKRAQAFSVFHCFDEMITRMTKSKGLNASAANIQKHQVCRNHLRSFVSSEYGWREFPFSRINRQFVDRFVEYLKGEAGCAHNTTMKHLGVFKKVYRIALDNQWIRHNAFSGYRMQMKKVIRCILTEEEIDAIRQKPIGLKRLELVRDLFVFSCFSGLAYIDIKNLRHSSLVENLGIWWIKIRREKTDVEATIPLLQPARDVLNRWSAGWESLNDQTFVFSVMSNQKTNAYLKEIAELCGITKNISFHTARHSFATSIALCNGIPMETVSKMLGHTTITMTQHYSKVIDLKIVKDSLGLIAKYDLNSK